MNVSESFYIKRLAFRIRNKESQCFLFLRQPEFDLSFIHHFNISFQNYYHLSLLAFIPFKLQRSQKTVSLHVVKDSA